MPKHDEAAALAYKRICNCLEEGSGKDGDVDAWKDKDEIYHLVKAQAHLAQHIKEKIDPRAKTGENHLHKAESRMAMADYIETAKSILDKKT